MNLEHLIFSNLITSEEFARKSLPHLKPEYFHQDENKAIFTVIDEFVNKFNAIPTKEALKVELQSSTNLGLSDTQYAEAVEIVDKLAHDQMHELTWLLEKTEKFCQDKAVYNAIMESIRIMDKEEGSIGKGSIPQLLSEALAISFDTSIGHDFFDDAEERYKAYHEKLNRIPFRLDCMNEITKGGFPRKTINILLGGTGVGKSLCMCALAADNLMMGYNVLYITLELDEKSVGRRIDANLLGVTMDDLESLPEDTYMKMVNKVHGKTKGRLKVKEYPTSGAGAANFRHLLNELKLKSNFIPDIIYIDYLNICASSRLKNIGSNINSYTYIKAIAEELRGLASEFDVALVTATQTTRGGYDDSDVGITDVSESFGVAHTADWMCAIVSSEELAQLGQYMFKQLKSRYGDINQMLRFVVGVDKARMRLYDVEESAKNNVYNHDVPVMDRTPSGVGMAKPTFNKDKLKDFKV